MVLAAKPKPGDKVAVVSPSGGLPEIFPAPYELGLRRLRDFGLEPVEYPTTRKLRSTPAERAADLHAAWSDPSVRAVIASIGGDDQLTVLKHLDPEVFRADPKPFFGYSDNTNLLNYLYSLGLPAFHGGSVMVQFGRGGAMHPDSERSLRAALFTSGEFELTPAAGWYDHDRDWADPTNLETEPPLFPGTGWTWHGARAVSGRLWGGCLEIIDWQLAVGHWMLPTASYDGILFLETSEEMPSDTQVYQILRNLGERGLLGRFDAILWGRPKSWSLTNRLTPTSPRRTSTPSTPPSAAHSPNTTPPPSSSPDWTSDTPTLNNSSRTVGTPTSTPPPTASPSPTDPPHLLTPHGTVAPTCAVWRCWWFKG